MDKEQMDPNSLQTEGEGQNTGSANQTDQPVEKQEGEKKKGGIHNNALYAASMGRSATAQVDPAKHTGLAQTGTFTSYEGATAPGGGGSVGTGFASGKSAVDPSVSIPDALSAVPGHPDQTTEEKPE